MAVSNQSSVVESVTSGMGGGGEWSSDEEDYGDYYADEDISQGMW